MRKFTTECKEDKYHYSMVLSEVSYDEAMDWLQRELEKYGHEIYRTEKHINGLMYIWTGKFEFFKGDACCGQYVQHRMFYYDEDRGYLMGE